MYIQLSFIVIFDCPHTVRDNNDKEIIRSNLWFIVLTLVIVYMSFCSAKVHIRAETGKKFARKSGALDNVRESFKSSRVITDSIEEVAAALGQEAIT